MSIITQDVRPPFGGQRGIGSGTPPDPYHCVAFLDMPAANNGSMSLRDSPAPDRGRITALRRGHSIRGLVSRGPLGSTAVRVWTFTILLTATALIGSVAFLSLRREIGKPAAPALGPASS